MRIRSLAVLTVCVARFAMAPSGAAAATCLQNVLLNPALSIPTGPNPTQMVIADFNSDGKLDLAIAVAQLSHPGQPGAVQVRLGASAFSFSSPVSYTMPGDPIGITSGDFNSDNILDLAISSTGAQVISILLGNGSNGEGNGSFTPGSSVPAGSKAFHVVAADLDRDGILDLAISSDASPWLSVFRGNGSDGHGNGTFGSPIPISNGHVSTGIIAADLNNDDVLDLVATENNNSTLAVVLGTGDAPLGAGSFGSPNHVSAGTVPYDLTAADFDEDGAIDLAVASIGGGASILMGNGSGGFTASANLNSGTTTGVTARDLDLDGITDLVVTQNVASGYGNVGVYLGQGSNGIGSGQFGAGTSYPMGADPYQFAIDDLDGDGRLDVVASAFFGTIVAILPGTCHPDPRAPVLTRVRDVPFDDGGRVFLTWTASSLDVTGGTVQNYRVWRRIPPAAAEAMRKNSATSSRVMSRPLFRANGTSDIEYWEALVTQPAQRLAGYGYTAPTTRDSTAEGNPYTAFFISALTADIDVFYSSNVDSGYSVDNKAPSGPANVVASAVGAGIHLAWDASDEADLHSYHVHRAPTPDFQPSPANLLAATETPEYLDATGSPGSFYKVSTLDTHGNESPFTLAEAGLTTGVPGSGPPRFALRGSVPNPARPGLLSIACTLVEEGPGTLELLDPAGRRVRSVALSGRAPGDQLIAIPDAASLAPGIYIVRLSQASHRARQKILITR